MTLAQLPARTWRGLGDASYWLCVLFLPPTCLVLLAAALVQPRIGRPQADASFYMTVNCKWCSQLGFLFLFIFLLLRWALAILPRPVLNSWTQDLPASGS